MIYRGLRNYKHILKVILYICLIDFLYGIYIASNWI